MRHDRDIDNQGSDLTGRIASLEQFTGTLVTRAHADLAEQESIPIFDAPLALVPVRDARVFLRSGSGHGVFADLTVTAPRPRRVTD